MIQVIKIEVDDRAIPFRGQYSNSPIVQIRERLDTLVSELFPSSEQLGSEDRIHWSSSVGHRIHFVRIIRAIGTVTRWVWALTDGLRRSRSRWHKPWHKWTGVLRNRDMQWLGEKQNTKSRSWNNKWDNTEDMIFTDYFANYQVHTWTLSPLSQPAHLTSILHVSDLVNNNAESRSAENSIRS